jgi:acyl-coenzyme A thioesterase PaaI-like protein
MGVGPADGAGDAFQDLMPFNHCWGCGADNPAGLLLKSRWSAVDPEVAVATFRPRAEHMAGPRHVLNGGIIATILDCHGVCTSVADAYRHEGRAIGRGETIWFATGSLDITYRAPVPIDAPVELHAEVVERGERKTLVECTLAAGGDVCTRAAVTAVRVPPSWLGA